MFRCIFYVYVYLYNSALLVVDEYETFQSFIGISLLLVNIFVPGGALVSALVS